MNTLVFETALTSGQTLQLIRGDITAEATDAIVNAANQYLQHGAGIAGSVVQRGGPSIQAESNTWVRTRGPVSHEAPAWTSAGQLPCSYVIHAVGPVWSEGDEDAKLEACVQGSLAVADDLHLRSVSFPAIATGIFGFPRERAAAVMIDAIRIYFERKPGSGCQLVRLVLFDTPTLMAFQKSWHDHFDS